LLLLAGLSRIIRVLTTIRSGFEKIK
jgi:hypothetical protein